MTDLSNSNNWELKYEDSLQASSFTLDGKTIYEPFTEIPFPLTFTSNICGVLVTCSHASPTWRYGGLLVRKIRTGLTPGSNFNTIISTRKITLGEPNISFFEQNTESYALFLIPPTWFNQVSIKAWEYVGT